MDRTARLTARHKTASPLLLQLTQAAKFLPPQQETDLQEAWEQAYPNGIEDGLEGLVPQVKQQLTELVMLSKRWNEETSTKCSLDEESY